MLDCTCANCDTSITTRIYEPWLRNSVAPASPQSNAPRKQAPTASAHTEAPKQQGPLIAQRFRLMHQLGRGRSGTVFCAEQSSLGRMCAIKLIAAWQEGSNSQLVDRFFQATSLTSRLTSQHTVRIFDFGRAETGQPYIVMELIDGRTLAEIIEQDGALSERRTLRITYQICKSLREAHALKLTHGDLTETNVMVADLPDTPDFVKVMDFAVGGTMATDDTPTADEKSDIRALGVLMVRMLAGTTPTDDQTDELRALTSLRKTGKVSKPLAAIIRHCLEIRTNNIQGSVQDLMLALRGSVKVRSRRPSWVPTLTG
jgi:serine/threonine protein kinase